MDPSSTSSSSMVSTPSPRASERRGSPSGGSKKSVPGFDELEEDSAMSSQSSSSSSASSPTTSRPTIFTRHWDDSLGVQVLTPNENMSISERKELSRHMAEEVRLPQMLTTAQLEATGNFEPEPTTILWHKTESGGNPAWLEVTAEQLHKVDRLEPLLRMRKKLLHVDYEPNLAAICKQARSNYAETSGTIYQFGLTFQPTQGPSSVQLSPPSRAVADTDAKDIFCTLTEICSAAADAFIPELSGKGRGKRRLAKASLLPASSNNKHFTSMQINFAIVYDGLKSLKKFGLLHPDEHDDITMLTALTVLSESPEGYSDGRLNVTPLGISAPLRLCSIYYLSARKSHCSTGQGKYSVPKGSPLELPKITSDLIPDLLPREDYPCRRFTIPVYADWRLMEPTFKMLNREIYTDKGLVIFQDVHEQFKWMMCHYIVHEPEILGRIAYTASHSVLTYEAAKDLAKEGSGPEHMCQAAITCKPKDQEDAFTLQPRNGDVDHYLRLFSYTDPETGETQHPSRELAVETLEAIDTPNPEFEQLQKEFEEDYCGTKFGKTASGEDGSAVNWIPLGQQQPKWNPETDKVIDGKRGAVTVHTELGHLAKLRWQTCSYDSERAL